MDTKLLAVVLLIGAIAGLGLARNSYMVQIDRTSVVNQVNASSGYDENLTKANQSQFQNNVSEINLLIGSDSGLRTNLSGNWTRIENEIINTTNLHTLVYGINNTKAVYFSGNGSCTGTDKLNSLSRLSNGTIVGTCSPDNTGTGGGSVTIEQLIRKENYYRFTSFDSVTAGYTEPWVPTAIASGTTAVDVGSYYHPGVSSMSSSATASSGYCYQQAGTSTYQLGENYTSYLSIKPWSHPIANNLTFQRFGFQDIFTQAGVPLDGAYLNITQLLGSAQFYVRGITVSNGAATITATNFTFPNGTWISASIYVINSSAVRYTVWNGTTGNIAWTDTTLSNLPTAAGRETSHAICSHVRIGLSTVQILAQLDYMSVGYNGTLVR